MEKDSLKYSKSSSILRDAEAPIYHLEVIAKKLVKFDTASEFGNGN